MARNNPETFYKSVPCANVAALAESAIGASSGTFATGTDSLPSALTSPALIGSHVPSQAASLWTTGKLAMIDLGDVSGGNKATEAIHGAIGGRLAKNLNQGSTVFVNLQSMAIRQGVLSQTRNSFDGMYASVYGGGTCHIELHGVTKLYSAGGLGGAGGATDKEMDSIERLFTVLANQKTAVFTYMDGPQARSYGVIPASLTISRSSGNPMMQSYVIVFRGAALGRKFRHVESAGHDLGLTGSPTSFLRFKQFQGF